MKTNWHDLNRQEKIECYYSSLDLSKVNKDSKFNKSFNYPVEFFCDRTPYQLCVSAELYNKEQAYELFMNYLTHDMCEHTDDPEKHAERWIWQVYLWFVALRYREECDWRVFCEYDWPIEDIQNWYKPVFIIDL